MPDTTTKALHYRERARELRGITEVYSVSKSAKSSSKLPLNLRAGLATRSGNSGTSTALDFKLSADRSSGAVIAEGFTAWSASRATLEPQLILPSDQISLPCPVCSRSACRTFVSARPGSDYTGSEPPSDHRGPDL